MTPEDFLDKVHVIAEMRQKAEAKRKQYQRSAQLLSPSQREDVPEYYHGYRQMVADYNAAKMHAYGEFPEDLFRVIRPLQSEQELAYMRTVYEPITKDVFLEFTNTAKKSINNGAIEWPKSEGDDDETTLKAYMNHDIENFDSITAWASAMVDNKIIDGNGIVCAWPHDLDIDEEGVLVGEMKVQPYIYPTPMVVFHHKNRQGDHFIVETTEKSLIEVGGKKSYSGLVYRYFGPEYLYQADQYGDDKDLSFEISFQMEHMIGYTPATRMGGIARLVEDKVTYDSVFSMAVPHLNNAIIDATTLSAVKLKVMYPTRVVVREKCMHQEAGATCDGGIIKYSDGENWHEKQCPNCKGTGYVGVYGPLSELTVNNQGDGLPGSEGQSNLTAANAMAYVSPSTDIPKFSREEIEHHLNMARQVLHLKSEPRQSGAITATEKDRDRENTEAFIKPISDQIWRCIEFVVDAMGKMMLGPAYEDQKPTIHYPQSFDLITSADLIEMLAEAKEKDLPTIVIQEAVRQYMQNVNRADSDAMMMYELITRGDRLIGMNQTDTRLALASRTVQPWEVVLHDSSVYLVEQLYSENPAFFDQDIEVQIQQLHDKAKEITPSDVTNELPPPIEP